MAKKAIQSEALNEAINGILKEYNADIVAGLKKNTKDVMKELVSETKTTAPVGHRDEHYRDNISSKTLYENSSGLAKLWYVKGSDYRLSHLLNNGHALRDGGRYEGTNFIGKAVDKILPGFLKKIEEVLRNG